MLAGNRLKSFPDARSQKTTTLGIKNYNMELKVEEFAMILHGVMNEDGTKMHYWGFANELCILNWLNDEDLEKLKEDRDPADAPPCPYFTPQPGRQGKIIWLSGLQINIRSIKNFFYVMQK